MNRLLSLGLYPKHVLRDFLGLQPRAQLSSPVLPLSNSEAGPRLPSVGAWRQGRAAPALITPCQLSRPHRVTNMLRHSRCPEPAVAQRGPVISTGTPREPQGNQGGSLQVQCTSLSLTWFEPWLRPPCPLPPKTDRTVSIVIPKKAGGEDGGGWDGEVGTGVTL